MSITDDAIGQIKRMVQSGELQPGDRLPPEHELSERLGLSRNSLRESVKVLDAMRVLDVRRGDGTYVTSLEPHLLLEAMSFVLDFHHDRGMLEVFAVRAVLEAATARAAAMSATSDDLRSIEDALSGVEMTTRIEDLVAHDLEFHGAIAAASGNGYLATLLQTVSSQTVRARIWRGITQDDAVDRTLLEHRRIAAAIAAGDSELAAALMTVHVRGVEEWLRAHLDDDAPFPARAARSADD